MSDLEHRVGVKEANLVTRHLKLEGVKDENQAAMLEEVDQMFGIDSCRYDAATSTIHLAYDATHCSLDAIEALIRKYGAELADTWWNQFKESYYQFVDDNVRDNATHQPWSCHQCPPGSKNKH